MQEPQPTSPLTAAVVFGLMLIAVVASGALLLITRPKPVKIVIMPPEPTATPPPTATPEPYMIYVTGAVAQPETTVSVPAGSRVQDALDAAGGALPDADLTRVNLAGRLRDGDQVHVPAAGEVTTDIDAGAIESDETDDAVTDALGLPTPMGGDRINVNTATAEELDELPGVGPAIAARIIAYRQENGPFTTLESLMDVSGIGESTIAGFEGQVSFDTP